MKKDDTTRNDTAIALGAVSGAAIAGGISDYHESKKFIGDLLNPDASSGIAFERSFFEEGGAEKLIKDTQTVLDSDRFHQLTVNLPKKTVSAADHAAQKRVVGAANGVEFLGRLDHVSDVLFKDRGERYYDVSLRLNEQGLALLNKETAEASGLAHTEYDKAGALTRGCYKIYDVQLPDHIAELATTEKGVASYTTAEFEIVHGNWLRDAASKAVKTAEEALGSHAVPESVVNLEENLQHYTRAFRQSAPVGWGFSHMPASGRMKIVGWAIAGAVAGGWLVHSLVDNGRSKRLAQEPDPALLGR